MIQGEMGEGLIGLDVPWAVRCKNEIHVQGENEGERKARRIRIFVVSSIQLNFIGILN
jgi:hypothetical protein